MKTEILHECGNCGVRWNLSELHAIDDYHERVDDGGTVPSGQCPNPKCGALCYPAAPDTAPDAAKHTPGPGPWAISRDAVPAGHVQITVYDEATGNRIATVFESEAYADLIKAVPDMLEALHDAKKFIASLLDAKPDEVIDLLTNDGSAVEEDIAGVLAKAEGRE